MNILVVEDEDPKLRALLTYFEQLPAHHNVVGVRSVRSALRHLNGTTPDLVVLDMSLPTFDISAIEPGGRPQGSGGIEVMRHLEIKEGPPVPVVVVSAYEAFSKEGRNIDLRKLAMELQTDFPTLLRGVIYFDPINDDWRHELSKIVGKVSEESL